MEKLSKDKALQGELQAAQSSALHELLKAKGLEEEAGKAATEAMLRFAADHGLALTAEDLEPTKRFEPGGAPESILSFARKRLKGYAAPVPAGVPHHPHHGGGRAPDASLWSVFRG